MIKSFIFTLFKYNHFIHRPDVDGGNGRATNLPRLKSDLDFVKRCLREADLWSQLSDEEKEYCKQVKTKLKEKRRLLEKEKEKQRRARVSLKNIYQTVFRK